MKINKNLIILSLLLIFCISLGAVSAADNTDISVNDTNDDVATVESSVNVDNEISTVSEEGQINKSSEIYDEIKSATGTYNITTDYQIDQTWEITNNNVIIEGNNHTIYGNGNQSFDITGNNVTIQNLNFVNCNSSGSGGAIYFSGSGSGSGSVSGCSFVNCSAVEFGGAIYFYKDGSVSGCSFVNCSAGNRGGAICFYSGASVSDFVSGCSFVNCSAVQYGGAIYSYSGGSVSGCSFVNCSAVKYGGAIFFRISRSSVSGCSFVNCSAGTRGGAIGFYSGGSVSGCSFVNCSAVQFGGAIYFFSGGSVGGCSFVNCSANTGGAIYFYNDGSGNVSGCSFVNCSANDKGGAISFDSNGSVSGCSFVNCSANDKGGAISFAGGGSVNYCIFENNNASVGKAIYGGLNDYNFNFFSFKNDITFPKGLIGNEIAFIIPNSWVVLDVTNSGDEYIVKFVSDEGNSLSENMPDYTACLSINGVAKEIFIKNNTYNDTYVDGNYVVTSLNTGNVLANVTFNNDTNCSMNVSVRNITVGEVAHVVVNLPTDAIGYVEFYINGKYYGDSGVRSGVATFNISGLTPNKYNIKAVYSGDNKYSSSEAEGNLTVKEISKLGTNLTASGLTINAYASKNLVVTLKDSNGKVLSGKKLTIVFNGKNYTVTTNASGQAKLGITSKVVKNYTATIKFAGDTAYTGSSKSVKVVIKPAYVTVADIIKAAKTLKSYSSKNKKLPSTIKVGSYKLTHAQLTYLMTVAIKHIKAGKKTSTKVKVINVKYTTYNAKISKKIMKNGYLSVVNTLYSKGVKGTLPKYFTYGGKKIGYNAYAYSLTKILAFYSSNKRLPTYCVFVNY